MVDSTSVKPSRQSFHTKSRKSHKEVRFGSYVLGSTLGEGEFGKVKLGWRKDGVQPSQVAIKFIRRDSIPKGSERESKVHREINALKRLSHPNIVKLEEVLQNDKYIGIVLEYASGGELFDYILQNRYLKDSLACRLFSQLVSGVYYMHSKGIVHRDLKLENLLLDKHKNIIITDFGFVNSFGPSNELMKTSCGSPCYAAPELVISNEPYEPRKVDVWSCGVILYAMLAGYLPFDDDPQNPDGDNIARLYQYITSTHLTFPEYIEPMPRDLLRRILVPNPKKRLTLKEVRGHQWLSPHAPFLSVTPSEWDVNYKVNKSPNTNVAIKTKSNITNKNDFRRYSLIDTTTSSYGSHQQNSNYAFWANPLPPQTSSNHAIALPSSTSSTSISDQLIAAPKSHKRSHSYSSASLALQAVVDADETRHNNDYTQHTAPQHFGSNTSAHVPRSTTHTGISQLGSVTKDNLINYTIQESPLKEENKANFVVPKIPKSTNNYHQPQNQKLPGPGARKPRPTSYHPGLYSASESMMSPPFDFQRLSNNSPVIRSESANSISSLSNGKISQPSVDLSSAEGDIIKPQSPVILASKNFPTNNPHHNANVDEKSEILSKCFDENDNGSRENTTISSQEKRTNRYSAIYAAELVLDKLFRGSTSGEKSEEITSNSDEVTHDASRTTEALQTSNTSPTTNRLNQTPVKGDPSSNKGQSANEHSRTSSPKDQRKVSSSSRNSKNNSSHSDPKVSNPSNSRKTKRFSFLGFYGVSSENIEKAPTNTVKKENRKVLEPSNDNDTNIPKKAAMIENRAKETSIPPDTKPKRNSLEYTSFPQRNKEPSTAKKVMDFFKRRSMRVG